MDFERIFPTHNLFTKSRQHLILSKHAPRGTAISTPSCQQVILGMLSSADSLCCSTACPGRAGPGRTVLQVTAPRPCTCKSSHALVALTHVPLKKETKNLLLAVFCALLGSHQPCGHGSCCSAHNQAPTAQKAPGWGRAGSKCRVTHSAQGSVLLQATFLLSYLCTTQMAS